MNLFSIWCFEFVILDLWCRGAESNCYLRFFRPPPSPSWLPRRDESFISPLFSGQCMDCHPVGGPPQGETYGLLGLPALAFAASFFAAAEFRAPQSGARRPKLAVSKIYKKHAYLNYKFSRHYRICKFNLLDKHLSFLVY